jgi:uncharacterized glyoxalase superfamily protein PhnB
VGTLGDTSDSSLYWFENDGAENFTRSTITTAGMTANGIRALYVDDVDAHYRNAKSRGADITMEPEEMFWGDRIYSAKDNEGHQWTFAQHVKDVPPEEMHPPGA